MIVMPKRKPEIMMNYHYAVVCMYDCNAEEKTRNYDELSLCCSMYDCNAEEKTRNYDELSLCCSMYV